MMAPWVKVLSTVVCRVDIKFVSEKVIQEIKELLNMKNPIAKRKLGNRLIFCVTKSIGEEGLNNEPLIMKLVNNICQDNNYKIRRDGVIFLKEYLNESKSKILESPRFKEVYLPALIDFINDEDLHI